MVTYFVVSFVPPEAAGRLAALTRRFPKTILPQPPVRMHLTWRSFDGLPPGTLAPLKEALSEVAARHEPLHVELLGGGVFAGGAVWARVSGEPVMALQRAVDQALRRIGLPEASHPFVPHVTLGAGPPGTRTPAFLHDLRMRFSMEEIVLSTTGTTEYRVVRRFPLGATALPGA